MTQPATNLRVLCPSREKRVPGDFFTYEMPDGIKRFGRLIARAVGIGFEPHPVQHLVYFFAGDEAGDFDPTKLSPHKLLIPPLVVNQKPWTLGYFQRVARLPLAEEGVLPTHWQHLSPATTGAEASTVRCAERQEADLSPGPY